MVFYLKNYCLHKGFWLLSKKLVFYIPLELIDSKSVINSKNFNYKKT